MAGDENNTNQSGGEGQPGYSDEQSRQMFETLTMLAIVVEAAGGLERAIRLGNITQGDPEQEKQLYETVPKSRGGQNDHEDAESLWQTILDDAMEDPQGRATFNELRMEMDNIELAQARGETGEQDDKNNDSEQ